MPGFPVAVRMCSGRSVPCERVRFNQSNRFCWECSYTERDSWSPIVLNVQLIWIPVGEDMHQWRTKYMHGHLTRCAFNPVINTDRFRTEIDTK